MNDVILEVKDLHKTFAMNTSLLSRFKKTQQVIRAVDGVSFSLKRGETLGLVGESGSGKSTLGRTIIRLYEPDQGSVLFNGQDFLSLQRENLRQARRKMQMIFQDPYASLDPRMTIGRAIEQPLEVHKLLDEKSRHSRTCELLEIVGLKADYFNRYPHEFSGGQRQRIAIARAIALNPDLIIADEPVSALDVSIQAQILNLLKDLQENLKLTYLFISHDLSVVEHLCDRVAVMHLGKIVEIGSREEIFNNPQHTYTKMLLASRPRIRTVKRKVIKTEGIRP